jgi:glycosyltransferase involved in cell wall biosynthesis
MTARQGGGLSIGWIGNGPHYRDDLCEILLPALRQLPVSARWRVVIIGACGDVDIHRRFQEIPGIEVTIVDGIDWGSDLAAPEAISKFDIGVYPLRDVEFNRHKCGFKALEYMAMGVPVVASPIGANSRIISNGIDGYLAEEIPGWLDAFDRLTDPTHRMRLGSAGAEKVSRQFSVGRAARSYARLVQDFRRAPRS